MKDQPFFQREHLVELRRLLIRWLINSIAIWVAILLVPGIEFVGPGWQLGIVAAILGLLSALLRPILLLFTLPLIVLTLGLFVLAINAILLTLTSAVADRFGIAFEVESFGAALLGGLVISLVSGVLNLLTGDYGIRIRFQQIGKGE